MKAFKIIGLALSIVVVILIVTIAFLSPKSHMERSTIINSQPAVIYELVNNYQNYNEWSPWASIDPNTTYTYQGPNSGPGARMSWSSKNEQVGDGEQWIIECRENRYVKYGLKFGGFEGDYTSEIILEPDAEGTKVTWTYDGDVSNESIMNTAMGKVFGMFMDAALGPFYEKGLLSLKEIAEEAQAAPTALRIQQDTVVTN